MAKKISFYSLMCALCIVLGFVEHTISFDFIAPGVKIGLANSVALLLISFGDKKGAFAVNMARILLSALLFAAPSTLIYSLSGGMAAFIIMCCLLRISAVSVIGLSVAGAVMHNIVQLICALLLLGKGVVYYLPILLVSALISGVITGMIAQRLKRVKPYWI